VNAKPVIKALIIFFAEILSLYANDSARAFTCSEGGFSIWMPGDPVLRDVDHKSMVGNVMEKSYTLITDSENYASSYTTLPKIAFSFLDNAALIKRAKKGFLKAYGAREVSFQKIILGGMEGGELAFQISSDNKETTTNGKARFYLVGNRMYVMMVTANGSPAGNALMDRYLNSFKIIPPSGNNVTLN